jgi:hypothetical protein
VGDGITDAETLGAADVFICFAGVVHRPEVAARASAVVTTPGLGGILPLVCTADELDRLRRDSRWRTLVEPALG